MDVRTFECCADVTMPEPERLDRTEPTQFTVDGVARMLGMPVATLRSWNQRYGIGPGRHLPGRHRHYTFDDLAVVTRMTELVRAGVTAASAAQAARLILVPPSILGDTEPLIAAAERIDAPVLVDLISAHLVHHGVCDTWNLLCRPAFEAITARRPMSAECIEMEHALSWAVTTSLQRGVPAVAEVPGQTPLLLACTEGEQHVLPLEALRAALAERRRAAALLGTNVPTRTLFDALARSPRSGVVVLWSQSARTAAAGYIDAVDSRGGTALLAGPGWRESATAWRTRHLASLEDAVTVLAPEV